MTTLPTSSPRLARRTPLLLVLLPLAATGCGLIGAPPEGPREATVAPVTSEPVKVVASCQVLEFNPLSEEVVEARERVESEVRFVYQGSAKAVDALAAARPEVVFLLAHGWMNDVVSSREFTSALVKGLSKRAAQDGVAPEKVAFVAIHWDSKRAIFHESALVAELIGKKRVAPLLATLQQKVPQAKVCLVGHSLGGRLVLATLNGAGAGTTTLAHGAVLLEAAADEECLLAEKSHDSFGCFPLAPTRVGLLVNVYSANDDVLHLTYTNAMRSPAIGRMGAARAFQERFATAKMKGTGLEGPMFVGVCGDALSLYPGSKDRRVVNVDASACVTGHSNVMIDPIYDLVWRTASR